MIEITSDIEIKDSSVYQVISDNQITIRVIGNSSPVINTRNDSSPVINTCNDSSPVINTRNDSSPVINTFGDSQPDIRTYNDSSPVINTWDNSIVIHSGSVIQPNVMGNSLFITSNQDIKPSHNIIIQPVKKYRFFEAHNIIPVDGKVILYKRVSVDFKTQEYTKNETLWIIGSIVEHPNWNPTNSEYGGGKFHAVALPFFADEFRDKPDDRYIAIEIEVADIYEWDEPRYPHKIAFRKGKVLYECNSVGAKL